MEITDIGLGAGPRQIGKMPEFALMTQNIRKKGVKRIIEQQEKWFRFLPTPSKSVYTLVSLMPSVYQRENFEAMLGLFLEARGYPLPQHSRAKSPSALSRFLNIYDWSTRKIIRTTRQYILSADFIPVSSGT